MYSTWRMAWFSKSYPYGHVFKASLVMCMYMIEYLRHIEQSKAIQQRQLRHVHVHVHVYMHTCRYMKVSMKSACTCIKSRPVEDGGYASPLVYVLVLLVFESFSCVAWEVSGLPQYLVRVEHHSGD